MLKLPHDGSKNIFSFLFLYWIKGIECFLDLILAVFNMLLGCIQCLNNFFCNFVFNLSVHIADKKIFRIQEKFLCRFIPYYFQSLSIRSILSKKAFVVAQELLLFEFFFDFVFVLVFPIAVIQNARRVDVL